MKMKGQSAMEYLMTYGWAILIIVIVAAALYALGVFNPATYSGTRATGFDPLLAPTEWALSGTTFSLSVQNQLGYQINITSISVDLGNSNTGSISPNTYVATGSPLPNQQITLSSNVASGTSYSAKVTIKYIKQGGAIEMSTSGTLTGVAQ